MHLALALLKHKVDEPATLHPVEGAAWVRSQFCPASPFLLPALQQRVDASSSGSVGRLAVLRLVVRKCCREATVLLLGSDAPGEGIQPQR